MDNQSIICNRVCSAGRCHSRSDSEKCKRNLEQLSQGTTGGSRDQHFSFGRGVVAEGSSNEQNTITYAMTKINRLMMRHFLLACDSKKKPRRRNEEIVIPEPQIRQDP